MLISGAQGLSGERVDLRIRGDRIIEMGVGLRPDGSERTVNLLGGTVIPGLHDHHLHLHALAAALSSVRVGPEEVRSRAELGDRLRRSAIGPDGWIRAVGYHHSVAGHLDRRVLDELRNDVPVRVQDRSGALWALNSRGLAELNRDDHPDGRLFREDTAIRVDSGPLDLSDMSRQLLDVGVTGVTDATPDPGIEALGDLSRQIAAGGLAQRVYVLARRSDGSSPGLGFGPIKRILDDATLDLAELAEWVGHTHRQGCAVALHCVTVFQLVVAITVLREVGVHDGDRIEHAAMVTDDLAEDLADLGILVVTSPNFVGERGDQYLADMAEPEHRELWRLRGLMDHGVKVAGGTDAPFGRPDPWASMRAARDRRSPSGTVIGLSERVSAVTALRLFLGSPERPATCRELRIGARADLCLIGVPPAQLLAELDGSAVVGTVCRGILRERSRV